MIITRTPLRITLGGGSTDLPEFYEQRGHGMWINCTIDKYVYVAVKSRFEKKLRLQYSRVEETDNPNSIEHPIIRKVLDQYSIYQNFELNTFADLPSGTGLGSSGAFTVGLIKAINAHHHLGLSSEDIAESAYLIERLHLERSVGKQDQYSAAFGGLRQYTVNGKGKVSSVALPLNTLFDHLVLVYTGRFRESYRLLEKVKKSGEQLSDLLQVGKSCFKALVGEEYEELGALFSEGWETKKSIAPEMTTDSIDRLYEKGLRVGAYGGKLIGAGGGGFLLFVVPCDEVRYDLMRMNGFNVVGFGPCYKGSEVLEW